MLCDAAAGSSHHPSASVLELCSPRQASNQQTVRVSLTCSASSFVPLARQEISADCESLPPHLQDVRRAAEAGHRAVAVLGNAAAGGGGHHAGAGADVDAADVVATRAHDVQHCSSKSYLNRC